VWKLKLPSISDGIKVRSARCVAGILLCALLLTECVNNRVHVPYAPAATPFSLSHNVQNLAAFQYPRESLSPQSSEIAEGRTAHYRIFKLMFPSAGENGQQNNIVSVRYYESVHPGKKKLVIVLPIWGSHTYPSQTITQGILERSAGDTNVLTIDGDRDLVDWRALREENREDIFKDLIKTRMADRIKIMIIDTMRLIDWAQQRPNIDSQRIGLIGFSIGAMIASVAITVDPRIAAGVLVMGGANPGEIIATCPGDPESVRRVAIQRFGWSVDRYRNFLGELLAPYDPAHYKGAVDPRRVVIFDAYFDECVPESAREALWSAMGHPERFSFMYSHKMAFLSMTPLGLNYMRTKIYDFLDQRL
jgi:Phospholipase/Carboxylesterase